MVASVSLQKYYEAFAKRMKMAGIKPHHRIAIGVSGGADSMALCILASQWKCTELGENAMTGAYVIGLEGFIVDHGLRSESSKEATCVQNWVSKIGIRCDISKCEWPNGPPKQGHLEEAARNARYKILKDKCMQYRIGVLLVAHHADDQAELFVLRLSRHSGVAGLAGMAFVSQLFADTSSAYSCTCDDYSVLLVRPLLYFIKDDLYKICKDSGQQWVEDPSNRDLAFARNRIRSLLNNFQSCKFRSEVQTLIAGCRRVREVLNRTCDNLVKEVLSLDAEYGYAVVDVHKLSARNVGDLRLSRFLVLVLQFISQKQKPVRGRAIELLINYIRNYPCKSSLTIGGCIICPAAGSKGLKVLICFCDSPRATSSQNHILQKLYKEDFQSVIDEVKDIICFSQEFSSSLDEVESDVSFLHVERTEAVLDEAKKLQLISGSTLSTLLSLRDEMLKDFGIKLEDGNFGETVSRNQTIDRSVFEKVSIPFEQSYYFMNRFVISCEKAKYNQYQNIKHLDAAYGGVLGQMNINADKKCSACIIGDDGTAWIRYMKEADWSYLSHLVESQLQKKHFFSSKIDQERMTLGVHATGQERQNTNICSDYVIKKAREALVRLKTLPIPARRGLPVLVNRQGTLLGIPSVHFTSCPCISMSATFKPRVPLGGKMLVTESALHFKL
ncbi:hypothetical protein SUGI_0593060 [Cryptomeria japonica]|nr:hypothetical protein SUGI_0593060 [Cryptomeria japonica]